MKCRFTYQQLALLCKAAQMWAEDLVELLDKQGSLEEHHLYRHLHLQEFVDKAEKKLLEKKRENRPFLVTIPSVSVFTLMRCFDDEEDLEVIRRLRPIFRIFDLEQQKTRHYVSNLLLYHR